MKKRTKTQNFQAWICRYSLGLVCFLLFFGSSFQGYAENSVNETREIQQENLIKITGNVRDNTGEELIGVSIGVKGTSLGTITNLDGNFELNAPANGTLILSYIGYQTKEVAISGAQNNHLSIIMDDDSQLLEEIVVVGYGVQKKVNLTGSVSSIKEKDIVSRPVTNISSALGGLAAGVSVRQSSGQPGSDGGTITIRGVGTLNSGTSPLVIIDGIEGDMNTVNPQDIENISILKDAASASIYGSRAANGVILITTKRGTISKPKISFGAILSVEQPTKRPKFEGDYIKYMGYMNEAYENSNLSPLPFSESDFKNWEYARQNPNELNEWGYPMHVAYPNTDWWDEILKTKVAQNYNIGVTGGTDIVKYNLSLGYLNNPGVIDNTGIERYQGRANIDVKITNFLTVGTQTFFSTTDHSVTNLTNVWNYLRQTTPGIYPYYDGKYGGGVASGEKADINNVQYLLRNTEGNHTANRINTTWYAKLDILKGLSLESKVNYRHTTNEKNTYSNPHPRYSFADNKEVVSISDPSQQTSSYTYNKGYSVTTDNVLRYNTTIGEHDFGAFVGHNEYYYNYYNFGATGRGLVDKNIHSLDKTNEPVSVSGSEYDYSMRSFFGRINYAYKSRYLFEANIRRDGSSRFAKNNRWGTFPSLSVGWRLNEEEFMGEGFRNFFQNFKLRSSWGKLGNNGIPGSGSITGNYRYMNSYTSTLSPGSLYSFGGDAVATLMVSQLGNKDLIWENTRVFDFAIEGTFLNNRATFEIDYYNRYTDDLLYPVKIPLVMGSKSQPIMNLAEVSNKGVEVILNWRDNIGDFSYSVGANFSYNKNRVEKYLGQLEEKLEDGKYTTNFGAINQSKNNGYIIEGHEIGEYATRIRYKGNGNHFNSDGTVNLKGGPKDGMIRTEEDMAWVNAMLAAGYKFNGRTSTSKTGLWYGDFIYDDTNGDGNYGDATDRHFFGVSNMPKYNLGLNFSAAYKGFDFSMLWQGSFKAKAYVMNTGVNVSNLVTGMQLPAMIANNHYFYDPENPNDPRTNLTAKYPRLKASTSGDHNYLMSDFYIESVSYMRLKNLQIGYTLPRTLINKVGAENVRVFFSGENLLTITPYKGLDPEAQNYMSYPVLKQVAFGLNVIF